MNRMVSIIEKGVFAVRWMLLPLYIGLVGILGLYVIHFVHEIIQAYQNFMQNYEVSNILMLSILELVDMTLISQLVVMSIQAGYVIFIGPITDNPRWLTKNFGSSEQKIKLGMSIMGIMDVHFLHDFIETSTDWSMKLWLLGAVISSTLAFCLFNILMHLPMLTHHEERKEDHA